MSIEALRWAFQVPLYGAAKSVLVALADHADETNHAWPALARIERWSGVRERAARNALRELETTGLIRTIRSPGRTTSRYELMIGEMGGGTDAAANPASGAGNTQDNPASGAGNTQDNPASGAGHDDGNPALNAPQPGIKCPPTRHLVPPTRHEMPPIPYNPHVPPNESPIGTTTSGRDEMSGLDGSIALPASTPIPETPKPRKRPAEKTTIPDGWRPDEDGVQFAASRGIGPSDLEDQVLRFTMHHKGKGNRWKSWPHAWRTWCMNFRSFSRSPSRRPDRARSATEALIGNGGWKGQTIDHETGGYDDAEDPDSWRRSLTA